MHANESNPCILFLFWHCWQFLHKPSLVRGMWKYRSSSRHSVGLSTQHITTPMVKMSPWAPYLSISNLKNTWIKQGFYNSYLLPILVNIWSLPEKNIFLEMTWTCKEAQLSWFPTYPQLSFPESQALIVFNFCHTWGRSELFISWSCDREFLHCIYELAQVFNVFRICFEVTVTPTFDP